MICGSSFTTCEKTLAKSMICPRRCRRRLKNCEIGCIAGERRAALKCRRAIRITILQNQSTIRRPPKRKKRPRKRRSNIQTNRFYGQEFCDGGVRSKVPDIVWCMESRLQPVETAIRTPPQFSRLDHYS